MSPTHLLQSTGVPHGIQVIHHEAQRVRGGLPGKQESEKAGDYLVRLHLLVHFRDLVEHDELHSLVEFILQDGVREEDVAHVPSLVIISHPTKLGPLQAQGKWELRKANMDTQTTTQFVKY